MHVNHDIVRIAIERFKQLKKQLIFIIITFVLAQLVSQLYNWLLNFLPSSLQFDDTANNKEVLKLFDVNWLIPVSLIMGVILIPLVEELIFRHLIIHELGKKITYPIAAILSIILFTALHLLGMKSPFEIGEYLIIAVPIVIVYMRSGRNLAASFIYHALNNGFAFILMLLM
ncbi:CPBP family intramembrane glutamic endopeptidase [Staphylococcus pettenkoferi]|nr:CPBP family intramembrane glutamic endopeptidase [Staphylococcus pettenkoferi]MCY1592103.1 CPBP family intramembrane metalloprotease [Staphylococcus pettenkoferi]MCY1605653.1 CPBP family intramembrane metalloprotease [Staphylococcus pettenkoferi]MCY1625824.1 CPBP family intramembrane metalloprotease [Staphylococcus pettenkoferi]